MNPPCNAPFLHSHDHRSDAQQRPQRITVHRNTIIWLGNLLDRILWVMSISMTLLRHQCQYISHYLAHYSGIQHNVGICDPYRQERGTAPRVAVCWPLSLLSAIVASRIICPCMNYGFKCIFVYFSVPLRSTYESLTFASSDFFSKWHAPVLNSSIDSRMPHAISCCYAVSV